MQNRKRRMTYLALGYFISIISKTTFAMRCGACTELHHFGSSNSACDAQTHQDPYCWNPLSIMLWLNLEWHSKIYKNTFPLFEHRWNICSYPINWPINCLSEQLYHHQVFSKTFKYSNWISCDWGVLGLQHWYYLVK